MTIMIVGDSWGRGEWDIECTHNPHRGLEQYLQEDGHHVVNLSKGGISNLDIVSRISQWFERNPDIFVDKIFVFQAEFSKDYKHDIMQKHFGADDWNISTAQELSSVWIERFYMRLSEIAQEKKCKIFLIGGSSDTMWFDNMDNDYPGCQIACQSITNLIINHNHRIDVPVFSWFVGSDEALVKKLKETTDIGNLMYLLDLGFEREAVIKENPEFFYPDGRHPNRIGWKILYDFLKETNII